LATELLQTNDRTPNSGFAILTALAVSIALLLPLFPLPGPVNVSSIPWKTELTISLLLLIALVHKRRQLAGFEIPGILNQTLLLISAFTLVSLISAAWAASWFAALHHSLVWANYAAILLVAFITAVPQRNPDLLVRIFATSSLILGALAFFDFLTLVDFTSQEGTIRIRYAKFAEMLVVIAPILFAVALYRKRTQEFIFALIPGAVAWVTVMLSLSKGAFIAGVAGFVLFFSGTLIFGKRSVRRRLIVLFSVWIVLTLAFQFGVTKLTEIPSTASYISGSSDASRSTSNMRIFTWNIALEMIGEHPVLGVGADNFGLAINPARVRYASLNPDDPNTAMGEDYTFDRAHNEPIQILSELGIVGFIFFLALVGVVSFAFINAAVKNRGGCSPIFIASIAGCIAFAVSSMFSSFSFRAFQNGVVFFLVLGIAFARMPKGEEKTHESGVGQSRIWHRTAVAAAALLILYSFSKGLGHYSAYFAERASTTERSRRLFEASLMFDPNLAGSYVALAGQARKRGDWAAAAANYRKGIDGGLGISQIYSNFAETHEKNGDFPSAISCLREAIAIYPRSTFLRSRLAQTFLNFGDSASAEVEMGLARRIDLAQANGWYSVMTEGILTAHNRSLTDPAYAKPAELLPSRAITVYAAAEKFPPSTP